MRSSSRIRYARVRSPTSLAAAAAAPNTPRLAGGRKKKKKKGKAGRSVLSHRILLDTNRRSEPLSGEKPRLQLPMCQQIHRTRHHTAVKERTQGNTMNKVGNFLKIISILQKKQVLGGIKNAFESLAPAKLASATRAASKLPHMPLCHQLNAS